MKRSIFIIALSLLARTARAVDLSLNVEERAAGSGEQITGMIQDIYRFALAVGGILAFGAIVYGAIKWMLSAGNASELGEAKQWITDALLGLLLLTGATLILQTINPDIVKLTPPDAVICEQGPSAPQCSPSP